MFEPKAANNYWKKKPCRKKSHLSPGLFHLPKATLRLDKALELEYEAGEWQNDLEIGSRDEMLWATDYFQDILKYSNGGRKMKRDRHNRSIVKHGG